MKYLIVGLIFIHSAYAGDIDHYLTSGTSYKAVLDMPNQEGESYFILFKGTTAESKLHVDKVHYDFIKMKGVKKFSACVTAKYNCSWDCKIYDFQYIKNLSDNYPSDLTENLLKIPGHCN